MQRQRNKLCKYLWRWSEQSKSNRRITYDTCACYDVSTLSRYSNLWHSLRNLKNNSTSLARNLIREDSRKIYWQKESEPYVESKHESAA
jgi:hypothetical protein